MENKKISDFQGTWNATLNYPLPIAHKSCILKIDNLGNVSGTETATIEDNLIDQEIKFSGLLAYHDTYLTLELVGDNDKLGSVKVNAKIDHKCQKDGIDHYQGKFENKFTKTNEQYEGLFDVYKL